MGVQYTFNKELTREKLNDSLNVNTLALAVLVRAFFNDHGDPAQNRLTTWGHRAIVHPNMGMTVSVSDEGPLGTTDGTQMILTLYRDDGLFYEAYSNPSGEGNALPSAPVLVRELFLQVVGEMLAIYANISAFPVGTTVLPKTT